MDRFAEGGHGRHDAPSPKPFRSMFFIVHGDVE